jgi:hypothetical protein
MFPHLPCSGHEGRGNASQSFHKRSREPITAG